MHAAFAYAPRRCPQALRAEASFDLTARVKASALRDAAAPATELSADGRAASAPASARGRASTGGLNMLSGAARIVVRPGSRAAAVLAAAAAPAKPQPKWNARF